MIDNYESKLKLYNPTVVNIDDSNGEGTHWILFYPLTENTFIFDPLGKKTQSSGQWKGKPPANTHFYKGKVQHDSSVLCGYFVLHIAKLFRKMKPKTIEECEQIIENEFGRTADYGDVQLLKKKYLPLARAKGY